MNVFGDQISKVFFLSQLINLKPQNQALTHIHYLTFNMANNSKSMLIYSIRSDNYFKRK